MASSLTTDPPEFKGAAVTESEPQSPPGTYLALAKARASYTNTVYRYSNNRLISYIVSAWKWGDCKKLSHFDQRWKEKNHLVGASLISWTVTGSEHTVINMP